MKLSVVIPVLGQNDMAHAVIDQLFKTIPEGIEVVIIDNGSEVPFYDERCKIVRFESNIGVYIAFQVGFEYATGDVVAFFHSDLVVWQSGWVERVLEHFNADEKLGMIGFVGSDEIDQMGGRGLGSTCNFQGRELNGLKGSKPSEHFYMKESDGFSKAAVVDGCAIIIRRIAWDDLDFKEDWPVHHHYDRLISCQLLENGWGIGVLGIECDHFSGRSTGEDGYNKLAEEWSRENIPKAFWESTTDDKGFHYDWNTTIYKEAERKFLKEFRDTKHIIPIHV